MERRNNLNRALLAVGLLAICGLSYGMTARKLGFFLDDWYIIWTYRTFGAGKFVEFFRGDRPLFSYIYRVFIPIFKDSPLAWQLFAIFTKWLSAITLWILLKLFMPRKEWFTFSVAALFAVYPGFKFHYFAVMYSQGYALFAIYLLSHIFMVLALRNPKRRILFTAAALACQIIGIAPQEYYYGLELVRPVLIYLALTEESKDLKTKLLNTLKFWLPYIFILLGFTIFRVLMSSLYSYQIGFLDQFRSAPIEAIKTLIRGTAKGLVDSIVKVWVDVARNLASVEALREALPRLGLIAIAFLLSLILLVRTTRRHEESVEKRLSPFLLVLGLYTVLVAMIPFLGAGFGVGLEFPVNRFLLALSIGVSILVVSSIDITISKKYIKSVVMAMLIAVSVGSNYVNGLTFQKAWEDQKDFFAQLTWRAPQINTGTVVITTDLPFSQYFSGGSLTAPLNMIYAPNLHENPIPYQMILAASPQMNSMPELIPGQEINRTSRVFKYIGNTSNMITVYMPDQGCLQVLSPDTDPKSFQSSRYADLWGDMIKLSNLSRIDTEAPTAVLPSRYFGEVSINTWCYYYQQAALAEQTNQWSDVVAEYQQAQAAGFQPENPSEWLPLIKAHIHLGNIDNAMAISEKLEIGDEFTLRGLCAIWQNSNLSEASQANENLVALLANWHCEVN